MVQGTDSADFMNPGEELRLPRVQSFQGEARPPGSKSIANRALLLAALARGETELGNLPDSDDVRVLQRALRNLGVSVRESREGDSSSPVLITGRGGAFEGEDVRLNLENAGTAFRPLTAVLAAARGRFLLDGNEQMRKRPIGDLVEALAGLGARIESAGGFPPVSTQGKGLPGGNVVISGAVSSQFVSALLIAGPLCLNEELVLELPEEPVSKPYIDLTLAMMRDFGIEAEREGYRRFRVPRGTYVSPGRYEVECDASAATYFLAAGALPGCGPVRVRGLSRDSRQGDARFADLLERMGAVIERGPDFISARGGSELRALDVDMNDMPDAAMTLAALAVFARGTTHIRNIANLRVKESERIRGLRTELEKLGVRAEEEPDALHITPPEKLRKARISTYNDHRMAMAFAPLAFGTELVIENPTCVNKTYPGFFADFYKICRFA